MKIAFTSTDGRTIDEHFGKSPYFYIWEVTPTGAQPRGRVDTSSVTGDIEDQTAARAELVRGCAIVCTLQIGGPAAAKLVARRVHPMKTGSPTPVSEMISSIQQVLAGKPPPWLRRIMTQEGDAR